MNKQELDIMDRLHDIQLKLLTEFDRVCRKHNIKYYLAAGTLLGAVRHQDFIPWDDDVDIYLKREDYNKFIQYIDEFEYPFEIHAPSKNDTFFWDYATRLVYKKSKLRFNERENEFYHHQNNEYLFLDIFILDKAYSGIRNVIHLCQLKIIYGMAMSKRYIIDYSEYASFLSKCQVFVLSHLGKLFSTQYLFTLYEKVSQKYNNNSRAMYEQPTNITVKFLGKLFYKEKWHQETTELTIRNKKFLVPKSYKEILKSVYGDYMSLPPEEARKPEHIAVLDKIQIE